MLMVIDSVQSIVDSLDEFTEAEVMKEDNAVFCERCQSKQTAEKSIKFKSFPLILNLQLKR
jgi:ubiquitin C-terminal hydrolase